MQHAIVDVQATSWLSGGFLEPDLTACPLQVVLLAVCNPSAHLMYAVLPAIDCRLPFAYMCGGEVRVFSWQPSFPYTWKAL